MSWASHFYEISLLGLGHKNEASLAKEQWIICRRLEKKMSFHLDVTLLLTRKVIALSWKPPLHLEATPWLKDLWRCASVKGIHLCESITPNVQWTELWFHGLMPTAQISLSAAFTRKWQSGMDEQELDIL